MNSPMHLSNDEWPEIVKVARPGETYRVKMEDMDRKPRRTINVKDISADDLLDLQRKDAFLYYSIPGVRRARMLLEDVDASDLGRGPGMRRDYASSPSRLQASALRTQQPDTVTRRTCIATECHPDLLMAEALTNDEPDLEAEDPLNTLIRSKFGLWH